MSKINSLKYLFLGLILISSTLLVSAQQYNCPMNDGSYGSGISILYWITWIILLGVGVSAIYWLIKSANRKK